MNLLTFDLNLLRVLDALLQDQSTVKAARRVRLSQPAVSAALGRLRDTLKDPLFVRQGQRLVPTEYAKSLELPLHRLLGELTELLSGPGAFDPQAAHQSFKIAGSDFFAEMLMPPLAPLLARTAPNVRVQLVELTPGAHVATLEKPDIDLALVPMEVFPTWVDSTKLFRGTFVVVARKGHPVLRRARLADGDTIPLDLFCELGHAMFSPEGKLKAMGDAALARLGRERRVVMTMPTFGGVCHAVAESDLVALLPVRLAQRMAPRLKLSVYAAPMPLEPAQICMAWHRRNTGNPAHRWLREQVAGVLVPLDVG
jgi:DNA-binding transcriptional LysR family regulator